VGIHLHFRLLLSCFDVLFGPVYNCRVIVVSYTIQSVKSVQHHRRQDGRGFLRIRDLLCPLCVSSRRRRRSYRAEHIASSFLAIIYCFLSTCLGVQIRRSDILEAFTPPTLSSVRQRDREQRERLARNASAGEYELDDVGGFSGPGYGRMGSSMGAEELEMRKGGRGFI
jgi:hypothetical protein